MFVLQRLVPVTVLLVSTLLAANSLASEHPNLVVTKDGVRKMVAQQHKYPLFSKALAKEKAALAPLLGQTIDVPVPKDSGGGYTHEQHKRNYKALYQAGMLYQITGNQDYLAFARTMLLAYAELFPTLGRHPVVKSSSPGRLFWQSLNEAVWLLYSIQAYDAIMADLSKSDRQRIEQQLFLPLANFLSEGQPNTFDRIHNHGTWATAAVGMTGYVLGQRDLVDKALYGLDKQGNSGFLKQMDVLFSPDGYYNEGPYYHRYALMPFIIFAKAIQNNEPALNIFAKRDGILLKAIYGAIQLSYNQKFFPLNDAIKDKGLDTTELMFGVAIAYGITQDPSLLSIAQAQGEVVLTGDGLAIAKAIANNEHQPFDYKSMLFRDGTAGDRGALAVLRANSQPGHAAVVMKNTSQGLGHGHFDKLSWLFYDNGYEIVKDYGASRFLNIEPKGGGGYLPENKTWAKQSIAHNTLVVDETSHFNGKWREAEKHSPKILAFDVSDKIQLTAASMDNAYKDVRFIRTIAMINDDSLEHPIVVDVLNVQSDTHHQYDLPLFYAGQIINNAVSMTKTPKVLKPLGKANGYQHLWRVASGETGERPLLDQVTWLHDNRFYTLSMVASDHQQYLYTQLGANDPYFNLLAEKAIIRRINAASTTFVSVLEPHGEYNGRFEYTLQPYSQIQAVTLHSDTAVDAVQIIATNGKQWLLALNYAATPHAKASITHLGQSYEWSGYYQLFER